MASKQSDSANTLTKREYAAIHLGVPDSGTDWIDEMIRQSSKCPSSIEHESAIDTEVKPVPQGPKNPPKGGPGKKIA